MGLKKALTIMDIINGKGGFMDLGGYFLHGVIVILLH